MSHRKKTLLSRLTSLLLPLAVIAAAAATAWFFIATKPVPTRAPAQAVSPQVRVSPVTVGDAPLTIKALGTVTPAKEIALKTRVAGTVETLSPELEPGHTVSSGHPLLKINPEDYSNDLRRAKASLAKAEADLALEMGRQTVAKNEYSQVSKLMPGTQPQDATLALRGPQLAQAQAAVDIAKADVAQAELSLKRTALTAPFNALITEVSVAPGHLASTSESLAKLVGTDEYWINAAVPLDRLHQLGVYLTPEQTLPVKVYSGTGKEWDGVLLQSAGTLSDTSRMGKILVRVDDPLGLKNEDKSTPLLLGDQVSVEIQAQTLKNVALIPRLALRSGDMVWVATEDKKLDIRKVDVLWKDGDNVYIQAGLSDGDQLIISELAAPVQGQSVRPWSDGQKLAPARVVVSDAARAANPAQSQTQGQPGQNRQAQGGE